MPVRSKLLPRALAVAALLTGAGAGAQDQAEMEALTSAYSLYLFAQTYRYYCVQRMPAGAAGYGRAFADWAGAQGVTDLDRQLGRLLPAAEAQEVQGAAQTLRAGLTASLEQLGTAEQVCGVYAKQLLSDAFDVRAKVPGAAALLGQQGAQRGPASGAPPGPGADTAAGTPRPAPPTAPATPAGATTLFRVAQLSSLAGGVVQAQPGNTPPKAQEAAVLKKLQALGSQIAVSGTVPPGERWLSEPDAARTPRWNVDCFDFVDEDDDFRKYAGQRVTVVGRVYDFGLRTLIWLEQCRFLPDSAGLKASSLPVTDAGWRFEQQPAETFLVAQGKGLQDSQILGVYLAKGYTTGVGGMVVLEYRPHLFLTDGRVYNDPSLAPDSFNAARSRQLEPNKWGRWTRQGNGFQVRWGDGKTQDFKPESKADPAAPGLKLSGRFRTLGGAGNSDVMVAVSANYSFTPDGRFTGGRAAGASAPGVVTSSSGETAGRYTLRGHNLTLRYDDGSERRLLFYQLGKDVLHIGGSDYVR